MGTESGSTGCGVRGDDAGDDGFVAMVLAGGLGTRLRAVVADRPKPLAPVAGAPFLTHLLDQLADAGCREVMLCTGHLGDQIERACGAAHRGMVLRYAREPAPLGTAGALARAWERVAAEHVLVLNGDSYCDVDLAAFVRDARAAGDASLVAVDVDDTSRFGALTLAADGAGGAAAERVVRFGEKGRAGPGPINAGVYWLPRAAVAHLPPGRPASLEHGVLPALVASGRLRAHRVQGAFLDIGVPDDYACADAFFAALRAAAAGVAIPRPAPSAAGKARSGLLVVDRDGTLIVEKHYLADPAAVELLPGVVEGLRAFAASGWDVAVVTNQSGIGRGYFDEATLAAVHAELERQLAAAGITLRGIWHCPHVPDDACACRKPEPALLREALDTLGYAPEQCLVVGDKRCDVELGARLGVRTALVRTGYGLGTERDGMCTPDVVVDDLAELARAELPVVRTARAEVLV